MKCRRQAALRGSPAVSVGEGSRAVNKELQPSSPNTIPSGDKAARIRGGSGVRDSSVWRQLLGVENLIREGVRVENHSAPRGRGVADAEDRQGFAFRAPPANRHDLLAPV